MLALTFLIPLLALVSCHSEPSQPSLREFPVEMLVIGNGQGAKRLLQQLTQLENTPIATLATTIQTQVAECDSFEARVADPEIPALLEAIQCRPASVAKTLGSDADIYVLTPASPKGRLEIRGRVQAGGDLTLDLEWYPGAEAGPWQLFIPDEQGPGPAVLNPSDALIHMRYRVEGGIKLEQLLPKGSVLDTSTNFKGQVLAGALLDGTWEMALYAPTPGQELPGAAVAIGFSVRAAAVEALEGFVREISARWPIHRVPFVSGEISGACLSDLNVMPDFAPCYAATDRAIVASWNRASLDQALDPGNFLLEHSGGTVRLDQFRSADAILTQSMDGAERLTGPVGTPSANSVVEPAQLSWKRLEFLSRKEGDRFRTEVKLVGGAP